MVTPHGATVTPRRARSWSLRVPDGAYSALPCWHSAEHWLKTLALFLDTDAAQRLRKIPRCAAARETILAVARLDAAAADVSTGRNVSTAHSTLAAKLNCKPKTVQRARAFLIAAGFAAEVVRGRPLKGEESRAAHAVHGGRQRKAASVRALILPRNVHLPPKGVSNPSRSVSKSKTKRASRAAVDKKPACLLLQKFAAEVQRLMPWLCPRGQHIGQLTRVLSLAGIDPTRWTPAALVSHLSRWMESTGYRTPTTTDQRNPLGVLRALLRRAIDTSAETPTERARREAAESRARIAARREAARREALDAASPAAVADVLGAFKTDPTRRRTRRNLLSQPRPKTTRTQPYPERVSASQTLRVTDASRQ